MATEAAAHYELKSDIAQFCFPAASRDSYAKYAYANSIFLAFLIIGIVGIAKTPVITEKAMPEVLDFMPVDLPPPVDTPPPPEPEEITDAPVEPPRRTPSRPSWWPRPNANVAFSVPVGRQCSGDPERGAWPRHPPAVFGGRRRRPRPPPSAPAVMRMNRGKGGPPGVFPNPPFIPNLLKSGESASVEIYLEVDADGTKTLVELKRPSGVRELDQKVLQHVRTRWRFEPIGEARKYTWEYVMQVN